MRGDQHAGGTPVTAPADPQAILRSRSYAGLLILAAVLGAPISAAAFGFLKLVSVLQHWLFTDLPRQLGYDGAPWWWPLPLLVVGGLLVALAVTFLPGRGGPSPLDGFHAGEGAPSAGELAGIALAALATLAFGAVLGPEAPLIALGAGLAAWPVRLGSRTSGSSAGRWSSASPHRRPRPASAGSGWPCGRWSSAGWCCLRRWSGPVSPRWPSATARAPARAPPTCCSPARTNSARC